MLAARDWISACPILRFNRKELHSGKANRPKERIQRCIEDLNRVASRQSPRIFFRFRRGHGLENARNLISIRRFCPSPYYIGNRFRPELGLRMGTEISVLRLRD